MAAPTSPDYALQNIEGVNFATTYTPYDQTAAISSTNSPDNPGPPFTVGTMSIGTDGTEYIFVKATESLVQYVTASIDLSGNATVMTLAKNRSLTKVGWPQVAIANNAYGWVALRGQSIGALARLSSLAGVPVYISNVSAGRLTTTSVRNTSGGTILGVVLTTSVTGSPSAVTVTNATWPLQSRVNG